jgi:hypothetical protein
MTTNPVQRLMIKEAMQAIAERKPGRSKLIYDKTKRTIVAVAEGSQAPQALNITADDADMFSVATLSAQWLRERWLELKKAGILPVTFSSWDGGDALTHSELCVQPSATIVEGLLQLGSQPANKRSDLAILLEPIDGHESKPDVFVSPRRWGVSSAGPSPSRPVDLAARRRVRGCRAAACAAARGHP